MLRTILLLALVFLMVGMQDTRVHAAGKKKIAFMAGTRSHGYGAHEHYAGCLLLAKCLQRALPNIETVVYRNGWPEDPNAFADADAIVMYCDGGEGHPVNQHLAQIDQLVKNKQIGVVCLHYAVEVPKGPAAEKFLQWIGGYFETDWSVNPTWTASFTKLPKHPITRGVQPFKIYDEWYYHMRFVKSMQGVTPILTTLPPASTLVKPDGSLARPDNAHNNNPAVREAVLQRKEPQHVAWAYVRPDGGRGFGFTGGHFHWNWGDPDFRKIVLNAIVWSAREEVPPAGVASPPVTFEELEANQDYPQPKNFDSQAIRQRLH